MQTEMKHTPGPWKYHLGRGAKPRFHIQTEGGYQIASTTELKTPRTVTKTVEFEENAAIESNARLIAAAPELLEALTQFMDYYEAYNPISDKRIEPYAKLARAAIAKAKGEV